MSGLEGTYRSGDSLKRREEVLERLRAGKSEKQIATDLGIERYAVSQIVEQIREAGDLPGGAATT